MFTDLYSSSEDGYFGAVLEDLGQSMSDEDDGGSL